MKNKAMKLIAVSTLLALTGIASNANATVINSTSGMLDQSGETLLEGWLDQGDLDWTSHWYGGIGATASSWHSVADTLTHTVTIFRAINALGDEVLVGGYAVNDWSGAGPYKRDDTGATFIFNLTQIEHQSLSRNGFAQFLGGADHFAGFGAASLYAGRNTIGNNSANTYDGQTNMNSGVFEASKGTIDVGDNVNYSQDPNFRVLALETFTFSPAAITAVPEPSSLALLGLGMLGLASRRFKKGSV